MMICISKIAVTFARRFRQGKAGTRQVCSSYCRYLQVVVVVKGTSY